MYSARELALKRVFDVTAAAAGLATSAPLLAVIAIVVRRTSPGPAIFRHTRVGQDGRTFEMLKFRTMNVQESREAGPQVTAAGDSRVTRFGRILRKTKLDELPELINVLRGEMSFVGPRPEVPKYVMHYSDADRAAIHCVRPGLTDPATIRFRSEEELLARSGDPEHTYVTDVLPTKILMYKEYLDNASLAGDLRILGETARVILLPRETPP